MTIIQTKQVNQTKLLQIIDTAVQDASNCREEFDLKDITQDEYYISLDFITQTAVNDINKIINEST